MMQIPQGFSLFSSCLLGPCDFFDVRIIYITSLMLYCHITDISWFVFFFLPAQSEKNEFSPPNYSYKKENILGIPLAFVVWNIHSYPRTYHLRSGKRGTKF